MRALIWAAVSTRPQANEDEKISLPLQESDARALCEREGWQVVDVLRVPGHSRHYIDINECAADMRRAGISAFDRLMDLWQQRGFDILIVRDGDRFARTQTLHAYVVERTIQVGARIYSLQDGWVDQNNFRMFIAMGGYRAASDVERLVKIRRAVMDQYARRGLPTSSSVIMSHEIIRDELGHARRIVVDESKRRLWNDAATLLLEGVGWQRFELELLNRMGHAKNGRPYTSLTFYNLFYHPTFWGNSARYFNEDHIGKLRGLWAFDPSEPLPERTVIYYDTHDPVFTGNLAEQIKAELRRRYVLRGSARPNDTQMFTGLLVCSECGYTLISMFNKQHRYYRCVTRYRHNRPDCSQNRHVREEVFQDYFHGLLSKLIESHDFSVLGDTEERGTDHITLLEQEIVTLEAQIRRLILRHASMDDPSLRQMYDEEILAANDRLRAMRGNLLSLRREVPTSMINQRERAHDELAQLTLEAFWEQPSVKVNQLLHRLMGNRRLVVLDGQIIGTAVVWR